MSVGVRLTMSTKYLKTMEQGNGEALPHSNDSGETKMKKAIVMTMFAAVATLALADRDVDALKAVLARVDDAETQFRIGNCYAEGKGGVAANREEAFKWYLKAAEQGHPDAQDRLAKCYYKGDGVAKDMKKAAAWFLKAAEQGQLQAMSNIGSCYLYGDGVERNEAEAVKWFRKASERGFAPAQCNLGYCYAYGKGVAMDKAEAVKLYRKSAEAGCAKSQLNLAQCYLYGDGVAKDKAEAQKWCRKAAAQEPALAKELMKLLK